MVENNIDDKHNHVQHSKRDRADFEAENLEGVSKRQKVVEGEGTGVDAGGVAKDSSEVEASTEGVSTEGVSTEPVSAAPVSEEPVSTTPASTEPVSKESVPTEPVSTEPVPTEPVSTEPVPTKPVPTAPVPTTASATPQPKFVFGSTTPFGKVGGFQGFAGMKSGKSVFDKTEDGKEKEGKEEEGTKPTSSATPTKIFGSNSSFGNAFQNALKKKSIFGEKEEKKTETEVEESPKDKKLPESGSTEASAGTSTVASAAAPTPTSPDTSSTYHTVHLEKKEMKSGEENETTLYQVKAKLYRMDLTHVSDGWRERGVGMLKVNRLKEPTDTYKARLIMRQTGNLKLILNLPIVKDLPVFRGMSCSISGDKFIRVQTVEEGKPIQYAVKIGQVENVSTMYETLLGEIS
ncbi:DEKNAAC104415 [Brettanomyces naardenensis]|uniref:DEKNAAC104415 n=1 Tax=Brettanomyces naardenensis TaxID=13370 RepID=A0A448YQZ0_BRENA|nr:DEKNAAC104415 [Brettanomyces naardenensis]